MKFKEFLTEEKVVTSTGQWASGKAAKKLLELSKGKALSLTAQWMCRKISLSVGGDSFHVVVAVHEMKENFNAWLVREVGKDLLVLATLENHGTHPGWHLHVNCDGGSSGNVGKWRYPAMKRLPDGKSRHRDRNLPVSQLAALEAVSRFFWIDMTEKGETLPLWK